MTSQKNENCSLKGQQPASWNLELNSPYRNTSNDRSSSSPPAVKANVKAKRFCILSIRLSTLPQHQSFLNLAELPPLQEIQRFLCQYWYFFGVGKGRFGKCVTFLDGLGNIGLKGSWGGEKTDLYKLEVFDELKSYVSENKGGTY